MWRPIGALSGLAGRVAGQLALALLPIGAIAIYQAWQIGDDASHRQETALLTATAEAAAGEALAIAGATGAVATLGAHISDVGIEAGDCSAMFVNVVRNNPQFSFAGFVDTDGILRCGSEAVGRDMRGGPAYAAMQAEREPTVVANRDGPITGASVIITIAPVFIGNRYFGYVAISVPHARIRDILHTAATAEDGSELRLVTFNVDGAVLSAGYDTPALAELLPVGRTLRSLVAPNQWAFTGRSQDGEERAYAVVPVIPGVIYALGSWTTQTLGYNRIAPILFPALMLISGLIVAFWSVDRLVISRIRELRSYMVIFSQTRRVRGLKNPRRLPREFAEIDSTWRDLATKLLHDEADLEDSLHERDVLLKEVHHRVKNNLQLIASIVNLKIRRATSNEARRTLGEVRMRVQSIASVHQALYAAPKEVTVRADKLLATVIDSSIEGGTSRDRAIEISREYEPVLLYPDQAVPFLLLASEAVTNALKYIGSREDGAALFEIELRAPEAEGETALLRVTNSCGQPFYPPEQVRGSGLGRSLIAGFATQLGGHIEITESEDTYDFRLTFLPVSFDPDAESAHLTVDDAA